jgi:hypothetical protein
VKTIKKIVIYIGQFLIIAIAVIVALRVLLWIVLAVLPAEMAEYVRYRLPLENKKQESEEVAAAFRDHSVIRNWITQTLVSGENSLPSSVEQLLYPATFSNISVGFIRPPDQRTEKKPPVFVAPPYIRVAQLSGSIMRKRIAIDDRLSKAYTLAQVGALTTILIGLVTTVLVALSSSEIGKKETRAALTIRTGALIFPALGTAAAAIIAFYDPNGTLARQSQVAAGLQQLHAQMSNVVWSFKPIIKQDDPIPDDMAARLDAWSQRYQELIASVGDNRITSDAQRKSGTSDAQQKSDTQDKQK